MMHNLRTADRLATELVQFTSAKTVELFQKKSRGRMKLRFCGQIGEPSLLLRPRWTPPVLEIAFAPRNGSNETIFRAEQGEWVNIHEI